MALSNRDIVELVTHGGARTTPTVVRQALESPGPVTIELDDWFVDVDASHGAVKVELDGVPDLRAEMPLEEFLAYVDEFAAR